MKRRKKSPAIVDALQHHVEACIDTRHGQLRRFPNVVISLVYVMCLNILFQGFLDLIVKFGGYTPWIVAMPWRLDFLFLTAISVLMGFQTLNGMREQKLDVTKNSVQVGILVETALIVGDLHFMAVYGPIIPEIIWFRVPFIVLTLLNIGILAYIIRRMHLFWNKQGEFHLF